MLNREDVFAARREFHAAHPGFYSAALHVTVNALGFIGGTLWAISHAGDATGLDMLGVLAGLLYMNLSEYALHRHVLHRKVRGMEVIYNHTTEHHLYFSHESMACQSSRDVRVVSFQFHMLAGLLAILVGPPAFLVGLISPAAGWLFLATGIGYLGVWEWLHAIFHLPEDSFIIRLPVIRDMQRRHAVHHDTRRMLHTNFCLVWSLSDRLFGTLSQE